MFWYTLNSNSCGVLLCDIRVSKYRYNTSYIYGVDEWRANDSPAYAPEKVCIARIEIHLYVKMYNKMWK